jgi:hypothetical protein
VTGVQTCALPISIVETLTAQLDIFESEEYVKIVAEVEKLTKQVKLQV